jgi:hypothetical protein
VATRVGMVRLEPAVRDAHDRQPSRKVCKLLHLAEREEGLAGQRLARLQHAARALGESHHPFAAEQRSGA